MINNITKNIIKGIAFIVLFLISATSGTVMAQEGIDTGIDCKTISRNIIGNENVIINTDETFVLEGNKVHTVSTGNEQINGETNYQIQKGDITTLLGDDTQVYYDIFLNNQKKDTIRQQTLHYMFPKTGTYNINAVIANSQCTYKISKQIHTFQDTYTIISENETLLPTNLISNIQQHYHYINYITFTSPQNNKEREKDILSKAHIIKDSKSVFVTQSKLYTLLPILEKQKDTLIGSGSMTLIVIANQNKLVAKKILTPLLRTNNNIETYLIDNDEFTNLMVELSIGQPINNQILQENKLIFDNSRITFSLNHIVDYLIYQGFPIDLISILLALALAVVFIVIRKQVLGLNSFGIFYPIIFAINLHVIGLKTTIGLFIIGSLSVLAVLIIISKINLLYSAKIGLTIITYIIFTLLIVRGLHTSTHQPENYITFTQPLFLLAYMTQLMVSFRIFKKRKIKSLSSWTNIILFMVLSFGIYFIFHSHYLQQRMLIHPSYILLVFIVTMLLGRYTGLQATEIIRFRPLIRKQIKK